MKEKKSISHNSIPISVALSPTLEAENIKPEILQNKKQNKMLSLQRASELGEIEYVKRLYGLGK